MKAHLYSHEDKELKHLPKSFQIRSNKNLSFTRSRKKHIYDLVEKDLNHHLFKPKFNLSLII